MFYIQSTVQTIKRDGPTPHNQEQEGESKTSVSWEPHTAVSVQTKPQQQIIFVGYTVALVHNTLFHTFTPSLSPRIFLLAQKENLAEFHREGMDLVPT